MDDTSDYNFDVRLISTCKTRVVPCPGSIAQAPQVHFFLHN